MSSDGGIYVRTQPLSAGGVWQGLNGNLQVFENYAVAIDANSKRLAVAAQDNSVSIQASNGNLTYNTVSAGDGTIAVINDRTLVGPNRSAFYTATQNLGDLTRTVADASGQVLSSTHIGFDGPIIGRANLFTVPFVLNRVDPSQIAVAARRVYVTQDDFSVGNNVQLPLTEVGIFGGGANATVLAYGVTGTPQALLAGTDTSTLFRSTTAAAGSLQQLTNYSGGNPLAIVFDPRTLDRFYVTDTQDLWQTKTGSAAPGAVTFQILPPACPRPSRGRRRRSSCRTTASMRSSSAA